MMRPRSRQISRSARQGAEDFAALTPEEELVNSQAELLLEQAVSALQRALPRLEPTERLYVQLALAGLPAAVLA